MKKLFISALCGLSALSALAWGQKGHDVTAYIAEQHLTPATQRAVDSLLRGKSMVYWANWLDNASHSPDYAYTKTWHYKNIDDGIQYRTAPLNPKGDVVRAVNEQVSRLADSVLTADQAALALKILIHCVGDMHQPMHMGHLSDLGGNKTKVKFFDNETNLHSIWDGNLPEAAHKWSYTEWQQQIDRLPLTEQLVVIQGTPDEWAQDTHRLATQCYVYFQPGNKVMYNEIARWTPTIEQQLLRGGLRLAHLLNSIYDPAYKAGKQ